MNWQQIQGQCRHVIGQMRARWFQWTGVPPQEQPKDWPAPHPDTLETEQGQFQEAPESTLLRSEGVAPESLDPDSGGLPASAERPPGPPAPVVNDTLDSEASRTAPSEDDGSAMRPEAFFHLPSGTVRFWVPVDRGFVGASIHGVDLHYRYCSQETTDQPLATYLAHAGEIEAAVRRRLDAGALEPVILRGPDLQPMPSP
ncbi:hypothetical protein [Ideonella sp. B508-1]|uniref:hypothetical protein n=1 Tax=Ideonella sp. B508-1 TaxID=137716 RepID=UPI0003B2FD38|nr:hypothetical protein [Ideonella sp. B508-1]